MSAAEEAGRRSPSAGPEGGAGAGARASLAARAGDRCRVCQEDVALDDGARGGSKEEEVIMPGCACRSPCHRACMEAWTRHKGDRTCELCGEVFQRCRVRSSEHACWQCGAEHACAQGCAWAH